MKHSLLTRQCRACKEFKYLKEFVKEKNCFFGIAFTCKLCKKYKRRRIQANNRKHYNKWSNNYRKKHKRKFNKIAKEYAKESRETLSDYYIKTSLRTAYPGKGLKFPNWLIETQRELIILRRLKREIHAENEVIKGRIERSLSMAKETEKEKPKRKRNGC